MPNFKKPRHSTDFLLLPEIITYFIFFFFFTSYFRGLVLQDLTFVHIGNNDYISDNIINFSKRWQQFNIVENMKKFKKG